MSSTLASMALPLPDRRWWRMALVLVATVVLLFAITVADDFV